MPRTKPNFQNGMIYVITCDETNMKYVGSTCVGLKRRFSVHRAMPVETNPSPLYKFFAEHGWDTSSISLVEMYPCENNVELRKREAYWIERLKPELNVATAFSGVEVTYRDDPKEYFKQYHMIHGDRRRQNFREWSNKRVCCPTCNKELNQSSLLKHLKNVHA